MAQDTKGRRAFMPADSVVVVLEVFALPPCRWAPGCLGNQSVVFYNGASP
jgi:hypothetical protein